MLAFLWAWMRRHPRIVDAGVAVLIGLPNLADLLAGNHPPGSSWDNRWVAAALTVALCAPLIWRRKWPVRVFAVTAAFAFVQWAVGVNVNLSDAALLCAAYTVSANSRRLLTTLTFLTMELGALLVALRWIGGFRDGATSFVMISVFVVAVMVLGDSVHSRRAYYAELELRAERLEREREQEAKLAVADERARIAREMHDVVAHNVSVMVVQAEGAAYVMDTAPERSRAAVQTVADTGRQALGEMRRLLGVLRSGEAPDDERAPQPGLDDLAQLVDRVRAAGLTVQLDADSGPPMDAGTGLTAFRVVQEALTNVLKHAGPQASATVRVERAAGLIRLTVTDDGRGAAADRSEGPGHGLRGMRERAGVHGGTLRAGPRHGGGFEVSVEIPTTAASG